MKILLKSNSTSGIVPTTSELSQAELAINTADGFLFTKLTNNTVVNLTSWDRLHNKPVSFPPSTHSHSIAQITNLQTTLNNKQPVGDYILDDDSRLTDSRDPLPHTHTISDLEDLSDELDNKADIGHTHQTSDIDGLSDALDDKSDVGHTHNSSEIEDLSDLLDSKSDVGHTHSSDDIDGLSDLLDAKSDIDHTHTVLTTSTSVGFNSLPTTIGDSNTAFGYDTLSDNSDGINNVAIGRGCLFNNLTGSNNCGSGTFALISNVSGESNCAFGTGSLASCTTGSYNCGLGSVSLGYTTTGIHNTGVGTYAGSINTTGSNNIFIGYGSNPQTSSLSNCIVLGIEARAIVSGDFVVGSSTNPINTSSTVGAAGSAALLPGRPSGYLAMRINGTLYKIPYYGV